MMTQRPRDNSPGQDFVRSGGTLPPAQGPGSPGLCVHRPSGYTCVVAEPGTQAQNDGLGLGALEGAVMAALWAHGEMTTPMVHESVGRKRGLAYTTILTTLQRLHKKGLLDRVDRGRGHAYTAHSSRDVFLQSRANGLAAQLCALGDAGLAAFLTEAQRLDPVAVASLRARLLEASDT